MHQIEPFALIGAGKLGEALLASLLDADVLTRDRTTVTARRPDRLGRLSETYGIPAHSDNPRAVQGASIVLVAVKPHDMSGVLAEIAAAAPDGCLVISVAAGVTVSAIESALSRPLPVVRAMPNTPARIGAGMTVISRGSHASDAHAAAAQRIFDAVGRTMELDERHMDAVTGLSASGPAFLYVVLESMAEGGVKAGLPRRVATELVAQATLGAARLVLETGEHPALLKDDVTTPAGCTIDGLLELEAGGLRVALIKAIVTATRRAGELG